MALLLCLLSNKVIISGTWPGIWFVVGALGDCIIIQVSVLIIM